MEIFRGGAKICPTGGLGSPTGRLYNRTEDIFLGNRTQFCVEKFPTGIKFIPDGAITAAS